MKQTIIKAASASGNLLMKHFSKKLIIKKKSKKDIVTNADIEAERIILKILMKKFPKFNYYSEEKGSINNNSNYTWIIDPLDGTVNYANKIPIFTTSIALKHKNEIILAVTYAPYLKELYYAEKGKGSFLNNKKIFVSKKPKLNCCISSLSSGTKTKEKTRVMKSIYNIVLPKSKNLIMLNSTTLTLAYTASSRIDNFISYHTSIENIAAGILLVKEANGLVTDFKGNTFNIDKDLNMVASNGKIHKELLKIIKKVKIK